MDPQKEWICNFSVAGGCRFGLVNKYTPVICDGKLVKRTRCPLWNYLDADRIGTAVASAINGIYIPDEVEQ